MESARSAAIMLLHNLALLLFPIHAERWVGDEVIEPVLALFRELVVGEGVSELNVLAMTIMVNLLH